MTELGPIVLWDVNGVLQPDEPTSSHVAHVYNGPGPDGKQASGTVYLNPEHGRWIAELTAAGAAHAWVTSWGRLAAAWIAPRLGYRPAAEWPVLDVGTVHDVVFGRTTKGQQVLPFLGRDRPAFWIDNLFGGKDMIWAEDRTAAGIPTVVRWITSPGGLARADIDAALAWLDAVRAARQGAR